MRREERERKERKRKEGWEVKVNERMRKWMNDSQAKKGKLAKWIAKRGPVVHLLRPQEEKRRHKLLLIHLLWVGAAFSWERQLCMSFFVFPSSVYPIITCVQSDSKSTLSKSPLLLLQLHRNSATKGNLVSTWWASMWLTSHGPAFNFGYFCYSFIYSG